MLSFQLTRAASDQNIYGSSMDDDIYCTVSSIQFIVEKQARPQLHVFSCKRLLLMLQA